ncbi:MAG: hypothetical protein JNM93_11050 [Bacteriovoracaceae bacterium]|nr:hypothetical protein [Bacteriovoracaceae bacterium]
MDLKQKASFFLVVTPGLEALALSELKFKFPEVDAKTIMGGIECEALPEVGFAFNHYLKIPTRVLLRFEQFKMKDLPKLFKKASTLNWRPFLRGKIPQFEVTARKSRIIHTGRLEKTLTEAIAKHYEAQPYPKKYLEDQSQNPPTVFLRLDNDMATLSLDTSGELLHVRGRKEMGNIAPLRETLASALLWFTINEAGVVVEKQTLFDPCCGSGTFLFEALEFFEKLERPFAYQSFPFFEKQKIIEPTFNKNFQFTQLIGHDIEEKCIEHANEIAKKRNFEIQFKVEDLFQATNAPTKPLWMICNPPYGLRIKLAHTLQQYLEKMLQVGEPEILGILVPKETKLSHAKYKIFKSLEFKNGGLSVKYYLLKKK